MKSIMKKIFLLFSFFVLSSLQIFSQQFKFAWITDVHIGAATGHENLGKVVADINKKDFNFVVVTGDIAERGESKDLETAKRVLDSLKIPYHIVPGNHDYKWSESCGTKFPELFGDYKFNFVYGGIRFIGVSTGIYFRGHGGHTSPETFAWLEEQLKKTTKDEPIIILSHHLIEEELDNWYKTTNLIKDYNIIAMLCGHGHRDVKTTLDGAPALMARTILSGKNNPWGYNSITVTKDSLLFFEEDGDAKTISLGSVQKKERNTIKQIDSLDFVNYNAKIIANINLNKTLNSALFADKNYIATATIDGDIYCYDSKGNFKWDYKTNGLLVGSPVVYGNILAAGNVKGDLITIDCKTGKLLKSIKTNELIASQFVAAEIKNENKKIKCFFWGTGDGKFFCYDINTLKLVWKNDEAKSLIEAKPLIYDGKIIFGSWDSNLYCLDLATGKKVWSWNAGDGVYYSPAACTPATDGKSIFVAAPDRFVSSIDFATGKTNWRTKEAKCWEGIGLSTDKKNVLVLGFNKNFSILSAADGSIIKTIECAKDSIETMPAMPLEANGNIMYSTRFGMVNIINKQHQLKPLLYLGQARGHSVRQINKDTFAVSGMDGRIVVFKINKEIK
jgi:outer membrane protein assembly factor BamB